MPTLAAGTSTHSFSTWLVNTIGCSPEWNRSKNLLALLRLGQVRQRRYQEAAGDVLVKPIRSTGFEIPRGPPHPPRFRRPANRPSPGGARGRGRVARRSASSIEAVVRPAF